MVGRKRVATRSSSRRNAAGAEPTGGQIYQDMLTEAGVNALNSSPPERPLKRRRPGSRREEKTQIEASPDQVASSKTPKIGSSVAGDDEDDEDEDVEFQDVVLPEPTMQTMELESDDEDEDEDIQFEDIDFGAPLKDPGSTSHQPKDLELNLTVQKSTTEQTRKATEKRKPISKEERQRRIEIHKAHLVCLLSHVTRRNHWCNDAKVQDYLRPHLTDKVVSYLNPGTDLSQFGRTESLKNGLKQTDAMWKTKFEITERGLRRALWAEDVEHLKDVCITPNFRPLSNVMDSMNLQVTWNHVWTVRTFASQPRRCKVLVTLAHNCIARFFAAQVFGHGWCAHCNPWHVPQVHQHSRSRSKASQHREHRRVTR